MKKKYGDHTEATEAAEAMEEVTPETAEAPQIDAEPEVKKEETKNGNLMYVGPTIQNLIRHGTVFADGVLPPKVNAAVAELPAAAKLFVPVDGIQEAMKSLSKKNSALSEVSDRMARKFSKR